MQGLSVFDQRFAATLLPSSGHHVYLHPAQDELDQSYIEIMR